MELLIHKIHGAALVFPQSYPQDGLIIPNTLRFELPTSASTLASIWLLRPVPVRWIGGVNFGFELIDQFA